ncbi:MAG: DNA polymerase III subunit [Patescibacteria group bacterium]|jgi:DNA polymerase-3 subunit delta'
MKTEAAKSNWPLVGNGHIFEFLSKSLAKKNISGSYIFTGPANLGKTTAAHFFARSLVCEAKDKLISPCGKCPACLEAVKNIHSDIYLIKREEDKKNISIEQVRDFIRNLSMSSFLNSYKVGIIKGAENLSEGAVSALLKTLEEPKIKVVIILTVTDLESLPKTIISRSQILNFLPVKSDDIYDDLIKNHQASRSQAKNFSRLSAGRPALALKFIEDKEYCESYKSYVKSFAGFLSPDINERFSAIENILGKDARGQEAVKSAAGIIDIWQNLARDLMLMELNLSDLIQHEAFAKELEAVKNKLSLKTLLNLINVLKQSREYLAANVNPRLALESVAVSF